MEKFSLDEYLKNPSRKVVTREGTSVRILCTDKRDSTPVVALITDETGREYMAEYNVLGRYCDCEVDTSFDLFFAPEKHEGWVNIYKSKYDGYELSQVYKRKGDAESEKYINDSDVYIATVKIEWEE